MVTPDARRAAAAYLRSAHGMSERRACRIPKVDRKPTVAALSALAALLGLVLVARQTLDHPKPSRAAWAILSGKAQARTIATANSQEGDLVDDVAAAGAMWARSHDATDPTECPLDPPALRRGRAVYATARRR